MNNVIKFPHERTKDARLEKATKEALEDIRKKQQNWEYQDFFKSIGITIEWGE
jgi:hypothetical protein